MAEKMEKIRVKVFRFDPEVDKSPGFEEYTIEKYPGMRVVEALERINEKQGANIAFNWSCREWHCGTCGVLIDGVATLLCKQEIFDGNVIEPLPLPVTRDLVVDRTQLSNMGTELLENVGPFKDSSMLNEKSTGYLRKLDMCMDCDICHVSCPYFPVEEKKFTGPEFMVDISRYSFDPRIDEEKSSDAANKQGVWDCAACKMCDARCPKNINPMEWIVNLRQKLIESPRLNAVPVKVRDLNVNLSKYGNPYGLSRAARAEWAKGLNIKDFSRGEKAEILYFVGCAQCYDTRDQEVARALVKTLKNANVDVGVLGREETCCGDAAKNTGEQGLYDELREVNIDLFRKYGIRNIVTTCPHGYNLFKNDYGLRNIEVQHYTQLLAILIRDRRIKFTKRLNKKVTYHDPCYLGRYNGVYDEPRFVLSSIPGLEMVEMSKNKANSACCGGGGGGAFTEISAKPKPSEIRVRQAQEVGAEIIAVACPFCRVMFEDAVNSLNVNIEVRHVAELVNETVGV